MENPYNDLQRIETPLLLCMMNAYTADYGRKLTSEEVMESKKIISLLQSELDARQMQQEYRITPKQ
ncbi:MAG: hypothetical protein H7Y01_08975 [Ferruginibacter sp.]|nr:hypothetical protein [Chitinophagaceae bacterium]